MPYTSYSIVVPAFNEAARIGRTLEDVLAWAAQERLEAEVIVVNDGSRDQTAEIVRGYMLRHSNLRLLENPGNRGKGYSVRHGMMHATGEIRLFSDADLSAPIEEASKLFSAIAGGADIAMGSRWLRSETQTQKQPLQRQFLGRVFNRLLRVILGLKFKDTQCGFKAFTRPAAEYIFPRQRIERWAFDPELLYLAKRAGLKVIELPVAWAHRTGTHIHPLRDGFLMLIDVLQIRWNALLGKYTTAIAP
ncbi:MAG: glycosyltransferase family 2 protein [Acidobacteriales bacterium]|nr:glycosyltransferase family 2 protein [Terriglobales bacterium]